MTVLNLRMNPPRRLHLIGYEKNNDETNTYHKGKYGFEMRPHTNDTKIIICFKIYDIKLIKKLKLFHKQLAKEMFFDINTISCSLAFNENFIYLVDTNSVNA